MPSLILMQRFVIPGLILSFTALGCSPGFPPSLSHSFDVATQELNERVEEAAIVAATVLMIYERTGEFPSTQFELLGSPEARITGLINIKLSDLVIYEDLRPHWGIPFVLEYTLLPSQNNLTDRRGVIIVNSLYSNSAAIMLSTWVDADHGGQRLDVAEAGQIAVRSVSGRLLIEINDGELNHKPYSYRFTPVFEEDRRIFAEEYRVWVED